MRVIAGAAKGRKLDSVPGDTTRPITDRAKEALFSILHPDLLDSVVLDLFAGTGGVGIEALSRGAARCTFVERNPAAIATIRANLERTGLTRLGTVQPADVFAYLERAPAPFDVVYVAPPQYQGLWIRTLRALDARPGWLAPGAQVIAQIHPREDEELALEALTRADVRRYGSVQLIFFDAE